MGVRDEVNALADRYWQARWAEGGTIVDDDGRIHQGSEAAALYDEMGDTIGRARDANRSRLVSVGVAPKIAALVDFQAVTEDRGGLLWQASWSADGYDLANLLPHLRIVEPWTDGLRYVLTDDRTTIVTCCEGDVTVQYFDNRDAFDVAFLQADLYYARCAGGVR